MNIEGIVFSRRPPSEVGFYLYREYTGGKIKVIEVEDDVQPEDGGPYGLGCFFQSIKEVTL